MLMSEHPPFFSVIIPTCCRPERLTVCLARLFPDVQSLPQVEFEIIVTDDSPNAATRQLVVHDFPSVIWTKGPERGPAANRNHGARCAQGKWLLFLDDDCIPSDEWLKGYKTKIESTNAQLIEGKTVCTGMTNHPFEERVANTSGGVFWSCNLAVEKEKFLHSGGFDEDFQEPASEDMEFSTRLVRQGILTAFAEGPSVEHPARLLNWQQLWKRALMIRWFSLYCLKTGRNLSGNPLRIIASLVMEHSLNLVRTNWRTVQKGPSEFHRALFLLGWNTLTFPILLPYLIYWHMRFRNALLRKNASLSVGVASAGLEQTVYS